MDAVDPVWAWTLRCFVALLFARAALGKLRAPRAFASAIREYELLPALLAWPLAIALLAGELALVAALLVPQTASAAALASTALLALYTGAIGVNLLRGRRDIDCGCSGPAGRQTLHEGLVARNVLYLGAALLAALPVAARALHWVDVATIAAAALVLGTLAVAVDGLLANAPRLAPHPSEEPA